MVYRTVSHDELHRPHKDRYSPDINSFTRYDNLFRLPLESIESIKRLFSNLTGYQGSPVSPQEYSKDLLNFEPGLVYPADAGSFNGSFRFVLENSLVVDIPAYELWSPLRGLDKAGALVIDRRYNELKVFHEGSPAHASVLGKAFLSQVGRFFSQITPWLKISS